MSTKLRVLRDLFGYSQAAVAYSLDIAQSTYCRYETGASKPDVDQIVRLAQLYGLSPGELIDQDTKELVKITVTRDAFIQSRIGSANL